MWIREVLALNLKALRRAKRMSQEDLAHSAEVDRTYVSALERTVYSASIDVVDRLARVLGVEAADLLKPPVPPDDGRRKRPALARPRAENRKASGARTY